MYEELAHLIKEKRIEKGISMRKLAILCDTNNTGLSKIESGKRNVSIKLLRKLCRHLDIYFEDCMYILGLGATYNIRNTVLMDTYRNLNEDDLVITYHNIKKKINHNNDILNYLHTQEEVTDNNNFLIDTIKTVEHENITNNYILKILEEKIISNYINEH